MKIKDTLHLGKTDFPMRAGLPKREPEWQKHWEDEQLYALRQKLNAGKPSFNLHDGPPYANGNIHLGHALNKISKDIIVRYKSMSGFNAPYVPGWDTHGLPIEQQLAKAGVKRKEMAPAAYLELCRNYALEQIDMQRKDFKSLGVLGDWDNPYMTLKPEFEAQEIRVFGKMAEKGYIYRGAKPIYWSWSSESSLAEAEVEYHDITSPAIHVAFHVVDGKNILPNDAELVIWTTTPWTIPANQAITVNPKFDYAVVQVDGRKFVLAEKMIELVAKELDWKEYTVLSTVKGSDLEYVTYQHPFYDRVQFVILADYVSDDAGTGLVHSAPAYGEDDFYACQKYKIEIISLLDDKAIYNEKAPGLTGMFYDDAQKTITKWLEEKGALLKLAFLKHSYPHDWRTKKPIIYRASPQWFASIDKFRQEIINAVDGVQWVIPWGKTRLGNMVRDRGDWVISRQRQWGVPLPIFYAENGEPIITPETIEHVAQLFEKHGSSYWFSHEAKELLPEGFTHPGSPKGTFTKENDIMDVWFDSGSSWNGVLNTRPELSYPADMYLEGSDQYRGWFNSSITTSVAVNGIAPYKAVLSQGFVLDGEGRKMSKSLGNTIVPNDVAKQFGADILRLWVASVDYENDVRVSMDILKQVAEIYRKIRNTMRFLLANTTDFNPATDKIPFEELQSSDKYMLCVFDDLVAKVRQAYEDYSFMSVYKLVVNFLTQQLSAFYLDFAKDVVYIEKADSKARRAMQTVMYKILVNLTKLLVPILPYTMEEIWTHLEAETEAFAYLTEMPVPEHYNDVEELMEVWETFMSFRDKVMKALEEAREKKLIGRPMEAAVTVAPSEEMRVTLTALDENIAKLLIVSDFKIEKAQSEIKISVRHAQGDVCERCRRTDETVGADSQFPMLCSRCVTLMHEECPEVTEFED